MVDLRPAERASSNLGERMLTLACAAAVNWIVLPAWVARGVTRFFPGLGGPLRRAAWNVILPLCLAWLAATIALGAALVTPWTGWTKWAAGVLCFVVVNLLLQSGVGHALEELLSARS